MCTEGRNNGCLIFTVSNNILEGEEIFLVPGSKKNQSGEFMQIKKFIFNGQYLVTNSTYLVSCHALSNPLLHWGIVEIGRHSSSPLFRKCSICGHFKTVLTLLHFRVYSVNLELFWKRRRK